ncbi:hypothetical protein D3260_11980 [Salinisphaera sp. Q1T1-3]|nr:hypothetical protein D3260_11980 [Salinisphaera sp. Q1T1-3]
MRRPRRSAGRDRNRPARRRNRLRHGPGRARSGPSRRQASVGRCPGWRHPRYPRPTPDRRLARARRRAGHAPDARSSPG